MDNFNTLSVDNKPVKVATLNGRVIYSTLDDYGSTNLSSANEEVSVAGVTVSGGASFGFRGEDLPIHVQWNDGDWHDETYYSEDLTFVPSYDERNVDVFCPVGKLGTFTSEEPQMPGAYWVFMGDTQVPESWFYGDEWNVPQQYTSPSVYKLGGGETTLSGTYVPPGDTNPYTYYCYNTTPVTWVEAGSGINNWFPISPTTFVVAAHYGQPAGSFTYKGSTYHIGSSTLLSTWASEHGFDINPTAIEDIRLVTTQEETALSNVVPLMSRLQMQGLLQRDGLSGLAGWVVPQLTATDFADKPQPVVFTSASTNGELKWSSPKLLSAYIDPTLSSLTEYPTYLGTTGDSGRPVVVDIGGEYVLVSHNHQVVKPAFGPAAPYYMTGPDYTLGYPAIENYVKAKGETLKTLSAWTNN